MISRLIFTADRFNGTGKSPSSSCQGGREPGAYLVRHAHVPRLNLCDLAWTYRLLGALA